MPPNLTLTLTLNHTALTASIAGPGSTVATATAPYETLTQEPAHLEQRPDDWWQATLTAITSLPADQRTNVARIVLTGDLRAILFLDTDRQPIRNAILAGDPRAAEGAPSVLQWLRQHQTIAYKRVRHLATPRGYLRLLLTNTLALDPEDAAITHLLDETGRRWSTARCDESEVNEEVLPPLLASGEESPLSRGVVTQLGVNPQAVLAADS